MVLLVALLSFLFGIAKGRIRRVLAPRDEALRLGPEAEPAGSGPCAASLVPHRRGGGRLAWAVVAGEGAAVSIGSRPVVGIAPIHDRDHLFVNGHELIFSQDALPALVTDEAGTPCRLCCETLGAAERRAILACPGCGLEACDACFRGFQAQRCPTCSWPAALARALWEPSPADFVTCPDAIGDER
jgi:hypothetical protein